MGVFSRLLRLLNYEKRASVSDEHMWINTLLGTTGSGITASGANVTADSALKTSTVFLCVKILSESIASLPLMVYKKRKSGGKDIADSHSLFPILHDSPNDEQNSFEFREFKQASLALRGNGYSYKVYDGNGNIVEIIPLMPSRVEPKREKGQIIYRYTYDVDQNTKLPKIIEIPKDWIWHIKNLSTDGITGLSPITCARESVGISMKAEEFGAQYFANAAVTSGVLEHPASLKKDAYDRLKTSIQEFAASKKHQTMILEEGMKWQAIALSNKDSQFLEARAFQVADIARFFNIPLILLHQADKASTYASAEQFSLNFVKYCLLPWCRRWEHSANHSLLTEWDRKKGFFVEFSIDGLLRGDIATRYTSYATGRQWGWLSVNDIRSLENMNPIPDGDEYISMPANIAGKENPDGKPKDKDEPAKETDKGDEGGTDDGED
jgi:HK97 family phage portal protein